MKSVEEIITELENQKELDPFSHPINKILKNTAKGKFLYKKELLKSLKNALIEKNDERLEFILSIIFYDGVDKSYAPLLCDLLEEDWHYSDEDIVSMLEEIKDPTSVNCLYETFMKITEYEPGLGMSLAKKCIGALGAINSNEAREMLRKVANVNDPVIREAALIELGGKVG